MKKTTLIIFIMLSLLLLADCLMYYYLGISLAGYYSDIILFWLWFFVSLVVIVLFWKKTIAKLFLTAMILTLAMSIIAMTIPFWAFVLSMTSKGLKADKNLNEKYRVQIVSYSVMTHPWLEIIEKKGIFEKKILQCTEMNVRNFENNTIDVKYEAHLRSELKISEAKDIMFKTETDSTLTLKLIYDNQNRTFIFDKSTKELIGLK